MLDIVVIKRNTLRGQAFVVYKSRDEAKLAMQALQGFQIFGKSMALDFALKSSYAYIVHQGKFVYKDYQEKYRQRKAEVLNDMTLVKDAASSKDKTLRSAGQSESEQVKTQNILLVENLPDNFNDDLFKFLFKQFPGLKQTKFIKERSIGFAEFLSHAQASIAQIATDGFKIRENAVLKVTYAKSSQSN